MRQITLAATLLLLPLAAFAQGAGPQQYGGGVITRDQFVSRAADMAGRRFDLIDTNHTGSITRAQLRAWRQTHQPHAPAAMAPGATPE